MSSLTDDYYPKHDRTSCSDDHPVNATADGSTGCARCTSIRLGQRDELLKDMLEIANMLDCHPDVQRGNSTVHWVYHKARSWAMKGEAQ